ncbi:hypothetical protein EYZ11_006425 [Aspergillus tanneri]|uniref:Uncharacterized protein n=1 Tax=Aspergillus tanneri TaxID=1220188 RepID=A0A4S3JFH0_9EURO|nr:uncharacterized protein ATNIH1004_004766 [Aspergillus tanneri]KAA8648879.1 hypothetical protein ATNIH1004_004766 [Aspergillus tanneri]THC94096.1 hypothetical protein EYZ11_006425 [Aspergillus tanneri]
MSPPFTPDSEFAALETPRAPNGTISITALARFEFEAGKANEGTKILMIEWEDDDLGRTSADGNGSWHVSWEGKNAVLPADEQTNDHTRRVYFLLPPNVTIPPVVTLAYEPASDESSRHHDTLQLNPLPAIFPPGLGADGRSAGKRGVLHTIWAKKRLQVLENEIRDECQNNVEGIALQMALQEKEWIEMNFGVGIHVADPLRNGNRLNTAREASYPMGPTTPVSPSTGGKLTEKLKGLKLQTGGRDLGLSTEGQSSSEHLLSPQSPDIAISSFNAFNMIQQTEASVPVSGAAEPVKTVAHYPPESLQAQQSIRDGSSGFVPMGKTIVRTSSVDSGEELFAKALSPRTPDLPRSPFSFAPETLRM